MRTRWGVRHGLLCLALAAWFVSGLTSIRAQEAKPGAAAEKPAEKPAAEKPAAEKPAAEKPPADKPAADKPAAEKPAAEKPAAPPADAPPADPEAAQKFAAKLAEWKEVLKALRDVRARFQTAPEAETANLKKEWDDAVARGEKLLPELLATGRAAYLAAPNVDLNLARFLVKLVADQIERDDFESAGELAQLLIDNQCELNEIYQLAGSAAFALNQFDKAEEYFQKAQETGTLTIETAKKFQSALPEYKKLWPAEEALRKQEAEKDDLPRVKLTTTKGDIVIELFENEAPETVGNFISLVESKFYNDRVFHRVLPNFMAQGGCPVGNGTGDPGYKIYCECYKDNHRSHFRGTLSMAHAGKDTGGSQFFLTFVPTPHLNGRHTVFGRVIQGMDVLAKLQRVDPEAPVKPTPDKILTAEVLRKRDHKYEPNKVK